MKPGDLIKIKLHSVPFAVCVVTRIEDGKVWSRDTILGSRHNVGWMPISEVEVIP